MARRRGEEHHPHRLWRAKLNERVQARFWQAEMPSVRALVGLGLVALARAAPAEHKITGLPGAPANLSFSQYAGSVEVDADLGKSLFYWFVEYREDP